MTRPSSHSDKLLIQAARDLFPTTGCSRLNLHQVAKAAGVNLGMFHYHFKTKDKFIRRVLQDFYEEFFENFKLEPTLDHGTNTGARSDDPIASLRMVLINVAMFVRDNQGFMSALMTDLMNGEELAIQFARENFIRHASILYDLVVKCQKAGLIERQPTPQIVSFMMSGIFFPIFIACRMAHTPGVAKHIPASRLKTISSDAAIKQRIDMALRGISTARERRDA